MQGATDQATSSKASQPYLARPTTLFRISDRNKTAFKIPHNSNNTNDITLSNRNITPGVAVRKSGVAIGSGECVALPGPPPPSCVLTNPLAFNTVCAARPSKIYLRPAIRRLHA